MLQPIILASIQSFHFDGQSSILQLKDINGHLKELCLFWKLNLLSEEGTTEFYFFWKLGLFSIKQNKDYWAKWSLKSFQLAVISAIDINELPSLNTIEGIDRLCCAKIWVFNDLLLYEYVISLDFVQIYLLLYKAYLLLHVLTLLNTS